MENIFETIATAINPKLAALESELIEVELKIKWKRAQYLPIK